METGGRGDGGASCLRPPEPPLTRRSRAGAVSNHRERKTHEAHVCSARSHWRARRGRHPGSATASNGATTTQFEASYQFDAGAYAVCSGVNVFKAGSKATNQDSETCQLTAPTAYFGIGTNTYGPGVWLSDSKAPSASAGLLDQSITVTQTVNLDGSARLDIVANY